MADITVPDAIAKAVLQGQISASLFDVTVPDAVLILGAFATLLTLYFGTRNGDRARKSNPPDPAVALLGTSLVDTATFRDLVEVLKQLVASINNAVESEESRAHDRQTELLETIVKRIGENDKK